MCFELDRCESKVVEMMQTVMLSTNLVVRDSAFTEIRSAMSVVWATGSL